jgi:hypothetical protein
LVTTYELTEGGLVAPPRALEYFSFVRKGFHDALSS